MHVTGDRSPVTKAPETSRGMLTKTDRLNSGVTQVRPRAEQRDQRMVKDFDPREVFFSAREVRLFRFFELGVFQNPSWTFRVLPFHEKALARIPNPEPFHLGARMLRT